MAPVPRLKPYAGPAIFSYGFRPFFLLGSIWAGIEVLAWLPMFYGEIAIASMFSPRDWHVHELLFGWLPAIITGFLLTAIPNWTGRLPLQGVPLITLSVAWLAGRCAVAVSDRIGWSSAAVIDGTFLLLVTAAVLREIIAGRNWRNLKIAGLLCLLAAANVAFHIEAHVSGMAMYSVRLGIGVVLMLVMVIGGRIIPSFTRNWLMRQAPGRLPATFDRFDIGGSILSGLALVGWIAWPDHTVSGIALLAAAVINLWRLCRWAGERTFADRLVLVLHVGYAFVPLGFLLNGLAALDVVPASAGIHAWTAGAMGLLTLAVMSRASLGHTGRPLVASPALQAVYAAALFAALSRIAASLWPMAAVAFLPAAAIAWAGAFLGFALVYAPVLCLGRCSGRG